MHYHHQHNFQTQPITDHVQNCKCNCGTHIVIDEQLLSQRQMWKQKYLALQKQLNKDIAILKQTIYAQCSNLMQQEFQNKQKDMSKIVNKKNAQIQTLTMNVIDLETKLKLMTRQKEYLTIKIDQQNQQLKQKDRIISLLKVSGFKNQNEWKDKLQQDILEFKKKFVENNKNVIQELQSQNQQLIQKLRETQMRYHQSIKQVEKLTPIVNQKIQAVKKLQNMNERLKRQSQVQISTLEMQLQELRGAHSRCRPEMLRLNERLAQMQIQIQEKLKKHKKQVKIQPVYIERPVQVEKIIERIVPVERIVKEYIQPQNYRDQALQLGYEKLKKENGNIVRDNQLLDSKIKSILKDHEGIVKKYEDIIVKYKQERETLAKKIQELSKQLQIVYRVKQSQKVNLKLKECNQQPENIKVYIKNQENGVSEYYTTGNERTVTITAINSPRNKVQNQRSTSRHKNVVNSQSVKRLPSWR